jgi:quaternary ammonium compound-resistance protein SugE
MVTQDILPPRESMLTIYKGIFMSSAWVTLIFAGLLEVCWAVGLKYTNGFTQLVPSLFTLITLAGSMYLLARAAQTLPIGTAYAVWVGIGAVGAGILGIVLFKEPATFARVGFMILLVISIIGLKATAQ